MSQFRMAIGVGLALSVSAALAGPHPQVRQISARNSTAAKAAALPGSLLSGTAVRASVPDQAPLPTNHAPAGFKPRGVSYTAGTLGRSHEFECSPAAQPEGEPLCGDDYVDTYNGGCASIPPAFQPAITAGVILGTSGTYSVAGQSGFRDTDWYVYQATEPTKLTWTVTAEFPVRIFLIDGTAGCGAYTLIQSAMADPCKFAVIEHCVPPGTYWLWVGPSVLEGVACGAEYCAQLDVAPCTVPDPIACPPDSFIGASQLAYGEDEPWQIFVSNDRFPDYDPANGVLLYEHFTGIGAAIEDIHWWGVSATYDDAGHLVECPLEPGHFHIAFWAHDRLTDRPLYEPDEEHYPGVPAPLYEFDAAGADLTKTDTGQVYRILSDDGTVLGAYTLWSWGCGLPAPLATFDGWISIQNSDDCPFWWAGSPGLVSGTGGIHVAEDQSTSPVTRVDVDGDLSWCLTSSEIGPFSGACCDTVTGVCRNTTADQCIGPSDSWYASLTCAEIDCPAEQWACCDGTPVECFMTPTADCGGEWNRFYVCSTTDPLYDPTAFGGAGNLKICVEPPPLCSITCDSPAAFGRALTGGYLYISWDRGPGDQRYVIDSFPGFTGAISRMKWWGNSTIAWDGPDCDFAQPAPFAIKFYHSSGTGPDYTNPSKTYDPIDATWTDTGYIWISIPEWGAIDCYEVSLPTTYSPGTGTQWLSIASKTADCDFIWAPGGEGGPGFSATWFYDNGVCEPLPGPFPRHRSYCLHTDIRTGACCGELTGVCINSAQEAPCAAAGGTFYPSLRCDQIPPPGCFAHVGACCSHNDASCTITLSADCSGAGLVWLGKDSICDQCCVALCPPDGIPEGEPPCYDGYVDDYDMGCFTWPTWSSDDFVPIGDGEVICGKTGMYMTDGSLYRDLDFYRYALTDPCAIVQARVKGEFAPDVWLMVGQCYTDSWCGQEQTYVMTYSQATADPCEYAIASAPLYGPDIYYIMVSCYGTDVACETPYTLEIEKQPAGVCTFGEESALTSAAVCLALGGTWLPCEPQYGACCFDCQCTVTPEWACPGLFMGADTTCDPTNPCCLEKGDANCDDAVNAFDIDPFVLALTNPDAWCATYTCDYYCAIDCNGDGIVNAFDIDPFVECLTGGCAE